jgi:hypothetical protein
MLIIESPISVHWLIAKIGIRQRESMMDHALPVLLELFRKLKSSQHGSKVSSHLHHINLSL